MRSLQVPASAPRYRFAGLDCDPDRDLERGGQWFPLGALQRRLLTALLDAGGKDVQEMVSALLVARRTSRLDLRSVDAWNVMTQISAVRLIRLQYSVRASILRRVRCALRHALEPARDDSAALGFRDFVTAAYDRDPTLVGW